MVNPVYRGSLGGTRRGDRVLLGASLHSHGAKGRIHRWGRWSKINWSLASSHADRIVLTGDYSSREADYSVKEKPMSSKAVQCHCKTSTLNKAAEWVRVHRAKTGHATKPIAGNRPFIAFPYSAQPGGMRRELLTSHVSYQARVKTCFEIHPGAPVFPELAPGHRGLRRVQLRKSQRWHSFTCPVWKIMLTQRMGD